MITEQNVLAHELTGLDAEIIDSRDPTLRSLKGRIVYETKKMLVLDTGQQTKNVPKDVVTLSLKLPDGKECVVQGRDLLGRPEDRVQRI